MWSCLNDKMFPKKGRAKKRKKWNLAKFLTLETVFNLIFWREFHQYNIPTFWNQHEILDFFYIPNITYYKKKIFSTHMCYFSIFWTQKPIQGSIFRSENDIYSPPLLKMIFFPLSRHVVFRLPSWPFFLNFFPILHLFYPFTSPFLIFFPLSSFFFSLSSFFFYIFPLFSSPFHIFSPKWHRLIFFPPPGGGVFSII